MAAWRFRGDKGNRYTKITNSTVETMIVDSHEQTIVNLYGLIIANTSASVVTVSIRDAQGGNVRCVIEVPANETRGFMGHPSGGMQQDAPNNKWTAQCDASVDSIEITTLFIKN